MSDVAVGDRVLATGKPGDAPTALTASRVILMKSTDIAEKNAAEQAQWRTNGVGGIVSSVEPAAGTMSLTVGSNKYTVTTDDKTIDTGVIEEDVTVALTFSVAGSYDYYCTAHPGMRGKVIVGDQ